MTQKRKHQIKNGNLILKNQQMKSFLTLKKESHSL